MSERRQWAAFGLLCLNTLAFTQIGNLAGGFSWPLMGWLALVTLASYLKGALDEGRVNEDRIKAARLDGRLDKEAE